MGETTMSGGKKVDNPLLQRAFDIKDQVECKKVYKDWAKSYDETMVGDLGYSAPRTVAELLSKHLSAKNSAILDLGCGTGLSVRLSRFLDLMASTGSIFLKKCWTSLGGEIYTAI